MSRKLIFDKRTENNLGKKLVSSENAVGVIGYQLAKVRVKTPTFYLVQKSALVDQGPKADPRNHQTIRNHQT